MQLPATTVTKRRSILRRSPVLSAALVAYLLALVVFVAWAAQRGLLYDFSPLVGQGSNVLLQLATRALAFSLMDFLLFFPLAFLFAARSGSKRSTNGFVVTITTVVIATLLSVSLAILARTSLNGFPIRRPSFPETSLLVAITLAGSWAGATWIAASTFGRWAVLQCALLLTGIACFAGVVYWGLLETVPMSFDSELVGTEDRRRLIKLFGDNDPRTIEPGDLRTLTLSEQDVNQLLTWSLSLVPQEQKGRVLLTSEDIQLRFSCEIPRVGRHLNIAAAGVAFVNDGKLAVKPRRLTVGGIAFPRWVLVAAGPSVFDRAAQNRHTRPYLSSLKSIELSDHATSVTYGHLALTERVLLDTLEAFGQPSDMAPSVAAYGEQLLADSLQPGSLQIKTVLVTLFSEAKRRTEAGSDPVRENRAALLAIGYLLGDDRISLLIGPQLPQPQEAVRWKFRSVKIAGRKDWARHFALSAGLEVGSTAATNRMIGLLKEELDADGGSGFSFADLLADLAGAKFARSATRDPESARELQAFLTSDWTMQDIYPPANDLPEGVSDAEFAQQFGGVGGDGYLEILAEIERRLAACAAYREGS